MKPYNRIDPTRTWKQNYQELAASCEKSQRYCELLRALLYDAETSGLRFICRTDGQYNSSLGKWFYQSRNGTIVAIDHENRSASTYEGWPDLLKLYASFGATHNVAAYQKLLSASGVEAQ